MIVFVPLILLISCNSGPFSKLSNLNFLVFLGEISFGVYILQKPIFMVIKGIFTALNWHQPILQFYISLIGLLLVSALSYHYLETPLRRKISSFKLFKK